MPSLNCPIMAFAMRISIVALRWLRSMCSTKRALLVMLVGAILILFGLCVNVMMFSIWDSPSWEVSEEMIAAFKYPLDIDMKMLVSETIGGQKHRNHIKPINIIDKRFIIDNAKRCEDIQPYILFVIKSKVDNFEHRNAIRDTWGAEDIVPLTQLKTVFLLGSRPGDEKLQQKVAQEHQLHGDIVQGQFVDSYYNNTIKLILGLHWASTRCPQAAYMVFVDDDFLVAPHQIIHTIQKVSVFKLKDFILGYVLRKATPIRNPFSKWHISEIEYPYKLWPPYAMAGCFVVPSMTVRKLFIASEYTKYLRFDDVYLGIIALKMGVPLLHIKDIYLYRKTFPGMQRVSDTVIALHGYHSEELHSLWTEYMSYLRFKLSEETSEFGN